MSKDSSNGISDEQGTVQYTKELSVSKISPTGTATVTCKPNHKLSSFAENFSTCTFDYYNSHTWTPDLGRCILQACDKSDLEYRVPEVSAEITYSKIENGKIPSGEYANYTCKKDHYPYPDPKTPQPMRATCEGDYLNVIAMCKLTSGCEKLPLVDEHLVITYNGTVATGTCKGGKTIHNPKLTCIRISFGMIGGRRLYQYRWDKQVTPYCYDENEACAPLTIEAMGATEAIPMEYHLYSVTPNALDLGTGEKIPNNAVASINYGYGCPCEGHIFNTTLHPSLVEDPRCVNGQWQNVPSCIYEEGINECVMKPEIFIFD